MAGQTIYSCQICREHKERGGIRSADSVREPVVEVIRKEYSGWSEKGYICTADLNRFRARYVREILEKEREYYTKFAQALPKDTVILTAGCAK
jgi:hydroxylamine reductase (hybrid-cluster protein)